jgi:hypothetical protein
MNPVESMVRDASDVQKLKYLGQPRGRPSTSAASGRSSRTSSSTRGQKSGRSGSGFTLNNFNKRGSKPGSSNRGSRLVSPIFHISQVSTSQSSSHVIVGGRVSDFASFWPSLTADSWILEAISLEVRIPFINGPFQNRPGANMSLNSERNLRGIGEVPFVERGDRKNPDGGELLHKRYICNT